MTFLAPPPIDTSIDPNVAARALQIAHNIGCDGCHSGTIFKTPATTPNGVPANFSFLPLSDFAVHDMGSLGDMIGNDGDTVAVTRRMRTAPLWGLRFRTRFLHDGRATDIPSAIRAHAGQGAAAASAYNALSAADQNTLLTGLKAI
jgi:CxxC motif-containing protein (DUF1111 family)